MPTWGRGQVFGGLGGLIEGRIGLRGGRGQGGGLAPCPWERKNPLPVHVICSNCNQPLQLQFQNAKRIESAMVALLSLQYVVCNV